MTSLKAFMRCRSKSSGCLATRSAVFIKFLPAKAAQCRTEQDDFTAWDWVVADHLQCGKEGQTPPPGGWQAARFQELWSTLPMTANANGNRFSSVSFDYNDI